MPPRLPGLDGPGKLDRPSEEEEFFSQCRLSRVRMADDAEGPSLFDLLLLLPVRFGDLRLNICRCLQETGRLNHRAVFHSDMSFACHRAFIPKGTKHSLR